jgi:LPXTG-site transpeptidase (sortase) family protein
MEISDPIESLAPLEPPQLLIPALNVHETIIRVPIVSGTWDLSQLQNQVGWLETTGNWPHDDLAIALVGHVTVSAVQRGPFVDLWRTHLDDTLIYRWAGTDYVYAIREKTNAEAEDIRRAYVPDGETLVLITCTDWDFVAQVYVKRLVVRAELIEQFPSPAPSLP